MSSVNLREELEATKSASVRKAVLHGMDAFTTEEAEGLGMEYLEGLGLEELGIETSVSAGKRHKQQGRLAFMEGVYSEQQVQKLCLKYRLRCLEVDYFKGKLDEAVPEKKKSFKEAYTEVMGQEVAEQDYRIVAPSEMFRLKNVPLDPLLMYRFKMDGAYYYKLVHQWGGDLNSWRAVSSFPLRTPWHLIGCALLGWSAFIFTLTLLVVSLVSEFNVASAGTLVSCLVPALTCITVSYFKDVYGSYQTSDRIWDSEYK